MKNILKQTKQGALCLIFTAMTVMAYAQPPQCDTCRYHYDHTRLPTLLNSLEVYTPPQILTEYQGCPDGINGERNISFIHGLGGSIASWSKQAKFTRDTFRAASFGVDYTSSSYEVSFDEVGIEVNNDIGTRVANGVDQLYPNRCRNNDFAIAHSQGGLASRHLDRYWDLHNSTYGTRKYYGLVTFAAPHAGADISLTRESHKEFVQQAVSAVVLAPLNDKIYDLTGSVGYLFGVSATDLLNNLDTLIKNQLAPLMLSSVHTPTLDEMRPNGPQMNAINNHHSRLHKVAFYGVEDAPECWKVMTSFTDTASEDYPLWGAQPDHYFQERMEKVQDSHIASIEENESNIKKWKRLQVGVNILFPIISVPLTNALWTKKAVEAENQNKHRQKAIDFLNNANTEWRYLIGSYHRDSVTTTTETKHKVMWQEKYGWGSRWYDQERKGFDNWWEAQAHYNNVNVYRKRNVQLSTYTETKTVRKFYPSDGVILVKSQKAFPGVGKRTDKMTDNNHFQERNSTETLRVMEKLYHGDYDPFFKIERRKK
jgi:pimeloyl-ACP methyl ester carboxylesterase